MGKIASADEHRRAAQKQARGLADYLGERLIEDDQLIASFYNIVVYGGYNLQEIILGLNRWNDLVAPAPRHPAALAAAEELVELLKGADDYSMDDVGKALADIAYDARLHQIGHAIMGVMCGELKVILQFPEVPPFAFGDQKKSA